MTRRKIGVSIIPSIGMINLTMVVNSQIYFDRFNTKSVKLINDSVNQIMKVARVILTCQEL